VWGEKPARKKKALALAVTLFSPPRVIMTREREFGEISLSLSMKTLHAGGNTLSFEERRSEEGSKKENGEEEEEDNKQNERRDTCALRTTQTGYIYTYIQFYFLFSFIHITRCVCFVSLFSLTTTTC